MNLSKFSLKLSIRCLIFIWFISLLGMLFIYRQNVGVFQPKPTPEIQGGNKSENKLMGVYPIKVEAGLVPFQGSAQREIKVENKTDQTLLLERIETTCGCTSASPPADRIEPKKSLIINIAVNNDRESYSGKFEHFMYVSCRPVGGDDSEMIVIPVIGTYE